MNNKKQRSDVMGRQYLLLFCLLIGCSSLDIQVFDYPKTNSKAIQLRTSHEVVSDDLDNFAAIYTREIKDGQGSPIEIMLYFHAKAGTPDLKEAAILKIDDKIHEIQLTDRTSFVASKDSDLVGLFGVSDNPKTLKGKITISHDVEQLIIAAKRLEFVVYAGNYPAIIKATRGQLSKIKDLLNYGSR
jgi:hypothetical protein